MKLIFKQRLFSWLDSYDIYDQFGNTVYTVKGKLSWGHKLHIMDKNGVHIVTVKQVLLTFLPAFELYANDNYIGKVSKKLTLFKPSYEIDFNGWKVSGNILEWDYVIKDRTGKKVAVISKEVFKLTDTYVIDVVNDADALYALMFTLAIDAEKCSRNTNV